MARRETRVLVKVTDPALNPYLSIGDIIYFRGGRIESSSPAPLAAELIAEAWPIVRSKSRAFAAGDLMPVQGATTSGVKFVVQPAPDEDEEPAQKTRRFEKQVVEAKGRNAAHHPFLKRLPSNLVQSLRRVSDERLYRPGDDIITQGSEASSLFMVDEGEVEVVKSGSREEAVLAILGPGEVFGEMSILTGDPTSATVRARTACRINALDKERLEAMLVVEPLLGREFSRLLATRIRQQSDTVEAGLDKSIFGSLAMVDPADLVQTMHSARRTGKLTLQKGTDTGEITFVDGSLRAARHGDDLGLEALYEVMSWRDGRFVFDKGEFELIGAIEGDTMGILMEVMRQIDENTREFELPGE
jgi:CRP-like cAMP-binding protein